MTPTKPLTSTITHRWPAREDCEGGGCFRTRLRQCPSTDLSTALLIATASATLRNTLLLRNHPSSFRSSLFPSLPCRVFSNINSTLTLRERLRPSSLRFSRTRIHRISRCPCYVRRTDGVYSHSIQNITIDMRTRELSIQNKIHILLIFFYY
jgi:hypothetical protein